MTFPKHEKQWNNEKVNDKIVESPARFYSDPASLSRSSRGCFCFGFFAVIRRTDEGWKHWQDQGPLISYKHQGVKSVVGGRRFKYIMLMCSCVMHYSRLRSKLLLTFCIKTKILPLKDLLKAEQTFINWTFLSLKPTQMFPLCVRILCQPGGRAQTLLPSAWSTEVGSKLWVDLGPLHILARYWIRVGFYGLLHFIACVNCLALRGVLT